MFGTCLENVRKSSPLIHCITNYVTVNDVANMLLASGGNPIMADDIRDVEDITRICGGLCINIGTLNQRTIPAMLRAGKISNELNHPILLDPVGAGASKLRTETAQEIITGLKLTAIRGNISEIKTLSTGFGTTKGVDADIADTVTEDSLDSSIDFAKALAKRFDCIIAITGAIDLVADESSCYVISNGRADMGRVTGTGCQLSALMTAFLRANPDNKLEAAAASVAAMGLAGEIAWANMAPTDGNATYCRRIIDAVCNMDGAALDKGVKYVLK